MNQTFNNIQQIGGLRQVELIDGPGRGNRLIEVNTGTPLRYDISVDRGADIAGAFYGPHSLCYLTANGNKRPSPAYARADEWLAGWPGGLMTTCGPVTLGAPREENGVDTGMHGRASNTPAELVQVRNPSLDLKNPKMLVEAVTRDARTYGPDVELHRQIRSSIGKSEIEITDRFTNFDNLPTQHAVMYHVNFGYPLLSEGSEILLGGRITLWPEDSMRPIPETLEDWKKIPATLEAHRGSYSRGFTIEPDADDNGFAHAAMVNENLSLAVELIFHVSALPRMTVWQHFGPGMYVTGLEPMVGTSEGKLADPKWYTELESGESRETRLIIRVHQGADAIAELRSIDSELRLAE